MMENKKINTKNSLLQLAYVFIAFAIAAFPLTVNGQSDPMSPEFKIYYDDGEIDLEKGISSKTTRLFVGATLGENDESGLKLRVSESNITLVINGDGHGSIKSAERISLTELLKTRAELKGAELKLEIQEYQTKDSDGVVETIRFSQPVSFIIPLI